MRKFKLITILCVIAITVIAINTVTLVYAYVNREDSISSGSKVGHAQIESIINSTTSNKVSVDGNNQLLNISIVIDCNVDAVVRVKIVPVYYDEFENVVVLPNNIIYNTDSTFGNWVKDESNMCFYFDESVKNFRELIVINSISFEQETISNYLNHYVSFVVEVDIIQTKSIDYDNHPWKDNAPTSWLEKVSII